MIQPHELEIYREAMNRYGLVKQINQANQELSECILALTKFMQKHHWADTTSDVNFNKLVDNIAEEIADVQVMTEQITDHFGLEEKVTIWKRAKVIRLRNKMNGGDN